MEMSFNQRQARRQSQCWSEFAFGFRFRFRFSFDNTRDTCGLLSVTFLLSSLFWLQLQLPQQPREQPFFALALVVVVVISTLLHLSQFYFFPFLVLHEQGISQLPSASIQCSLAFQFCWLNFILILKLTLLLFPSRQSSISHPFEPGSAWSSLSSHSILFSSTTLDRWQKKSLAQNRFHLSILHDARPNFYL